MIETHPFGIFVPKRPKYLLLGSFTTKEANFDPTYDWFYGTKRNQFWKILRTVYNLPLDNKSAKQDLFIKLEMALGDVIYQCERQKGTNLDANLVNIVFNTQEVEKVLKSNQIETIYFSSRFVEKVFQKEFKDIVANFPKMTYITLPSPSPRFAAMSLEEKIKKYRALLPRPPFV